MWASATVIQATRRLTVVAEAAEAVTMVALRHLAASILDPAEVSSLMFLCFFSFVHSKLFLCKQCLLIKMNFNMAIGILTPCNVA